MPTANLPEVFLFCLLCSGEGTPQTVPSVTSGKDSATELPLNTAGRSHLFSGQDFNKPTSLLLFVREMTQRFGKCPRRGCVCANCDIFYYRILYVFGEKKPWQCHICISESSPCNSPEATTGTWLDRRKGSSHTQRAGGGLSCFAVMDNLLSHLCKHMVSDGGKKWSQITAGHPLCCVSSVLCYFN